MKELIRNIASEFSSLNDMMAKLEIAVEIRADSGQESTIWLKGNGDGTVSLWGDL